MKKLSYFALLIILVLSLVFRYSENFTIPLKSDPYIHNYDILIESVRNNKTNNEVLKTFQQYGDNDNLNSMCIPCDTECKPECCDLMMNKNYPIYSCSNGCVCLNDRQYNYLLERGGNNIGELRNQSKINTPTLTKIETQFALS